MADPLLEGRQLGRSFGGVRALHEVNLRVAPGEMHGVIGPNGAGKSTLFAVLAGATPPTSGSIWFHGANVTTWPSWKVARSGLARTFQSARPVPTLTVAQNVAAGCYRLGSTGLAGAVLRTRRARREEDEALDRAGALLDRFGLSDLSRSWPSALTAGQRRLVELARALVGEPEIVLLDEPAAGLNRVETEVLREVLLDLRRSRQTCLLIEHDVELVLDVCDRVTVLVTGEVLATGSPAEIANHPGVADAYLGSEVRR